MTPGALLHFGKVECTMCVHRMNGDRMDEVWPIVKGFLFVFLTVAYLVGLYLLWRG